ncbi:hypothetical protein EC991_010207 [Linnemannia zychae]|nr:hypothetical protein EC991_010207 [Linnemannia zychae]
MVGMTLAWGPMEKTHQYGGAHGYAQGANVIVISPDQPQQYPQQQTYYPQQQQAPIPVQQQPQFYQYQQPVALDPNTPYQQQQQLAQFYQQQQQYQYPAASTPFSSPPGPVPGSTAVAYQQSPIGAPEGYPQQQSLPPLPPVSSSPQYNVPVPASQ